MFDLFLFSEDQYLYLDNKFNKVKEIDLEMDKEEVDAFYEKSKEEVGLINR